MKRVFFSPVSYLALIIILGFILRLYKIDNPVADWHSWRQADTAAVARNFFQEGFNMLYPRGDDMSPVPDNRQANLERYRFVEFPIYPALVFLGYLINGMVDERIARLVSIFFSLGSVIFIYLIARRYFGTITGLLASFIYATLPYALYYSRTILPEPSLVFFSLGMFYFTDRWIFSGGRKLALLSAAFTAVAFLTKPTAIFYLLPLYASFYRKERRIIPRSLKYWLWGIAAILPLGLWRLWISQHPEGIPAAGWLLNGNHIRFKMIFWKWILQDRFGREILGVTGSVLFFLGFLVKPLGRERWLLHLLMLSMFLYLIVFATGNVQHDYYQTLIVPVLAIFVARGMVLLLRAEPQLLPKILTVPIAVLFLAMTYYLTWGEISKLYHINNPAIVEAGRAADKILPKDAIVLAPYQGDTAFLYQINRHGFPVEILPVDQLIERYGVSAYVTVAKDAKARWVMDKYTVLEDQKDFVIVDLTRRNPNFTGGPPEPL